jgi:hypothetical protein
MKLVLGRQNPTFSVKAVQLRADITYSKATVSVIIDERGLNKYARDYVNEIDQLTVAFGKGLVTTQQIVDAVSTALSKPFAHIAWPEDEVSLSVGFIRYFADAVTQADLLLGFVIEKNLADSVTALERITGFGIETFYEDFQPIYDNADANSGDGLEYTDVKPAADLVGLSDTATSELSKVVQDAITPLETLASVFNKPFIDQSSTTDEAQAAFIKALAHTCTAEDALSYVFDAYRVIADSILTTDLLASIDTFKLLTDAAGAVSSGSLRMTDYADITYFAEDYVGISATFS